MTFKRILGVLALCVAACVCSVAAAADVAVATTPVEGTDYVLIDNPDQPSGAKVQVTEVFSYTCIHCSNFQPFLAAWKKTLPSDVQFSYMPAAFGGIWDEWARAFYAAQALHVQEKSHDSIYKAVFVDKRVIKGEDIPAVYADYGVDPTVFASTMQSPAVSAKLAGAHGQEMHWGIQGTPTLIVDGKYRAAMNASGPAGLLHTVDWLIARQRAEHASQKPGRVKH